MKTILHFSAVDLIDDPDVPEAQSDTRAPPDPAHGRSVVVTTHRNK